MKNLNSKQSRSSTKNYTARRNTQEMTPYPVPTTPSRDPPTVRSNPVKHLSLPLAFTVAEGVSQTIQTGSIRNKIAELTGLTSTDISFVLEYAHFWGLADSSGWLSARDVLYNVEVTDNGSFSQRPKVGIKYSKNIQPYSGPQSSDADLFTVTTSSTQIECRLGVRYWGRGLI